MTTVRLLSYNIHSMRDDRAALARVIRRVRPDVVCLQEAPRFGCWRRRRRGLAARTGLAPAVGKRAAGLELCTGPGAAVLRREHHLLTPVPGMHRRGVALGLFDVRGARFVAASVHLDLAAAPRLRHAAEITAELDRVGTEFGAPVVVAGDINEQPGGAAWDLLTGRFQDAYVVAPYGQAMTYSAEEPRRRIDGIFTGPGVEVVGCGVPEDPVLLADYPAASDHRPLLAELRVP